jgi:hypothetical protein
MKNISLLAAVVVALTFSGCGGFFKGKQAGERGIAEFHKLYNEGKFKQIFDASGTAMKTATPEQKFLDFLGAVQRKLGKMTQTTNAGFSINTFNLTTRVVLTQTTKFEQGDATEVFTFEMNGDNAILVGYNINSADLILK